MVFKFYFASLLKNGLLRNFVAPLFVLGLNSIAFSFLQNFTIMWDKYARGEVTYHCTWKSLFRQRERNSFFFCTRSSES